MGREIRPARFMGNTDRRYYRADYSIVYYMEDMDIILDFISSDQIGEYWRVQIMFLLFDIVGSFISVYNLPYASMLGTVCIVYIELRSVFENLKEKRSSAVEILEVAQKIIDCKDSDGAKQLIKDLNDKITKEEIRFRKNEKQYKK